MKDCFVHVLTFAADLVSAGVGPFSLWSGKMCMFGIYSPRSPLVCFTAMTAAWMQLGRLLIRNIHH